MTVADTSGPVPLQHGATRAWQKRGTWLDTRAGRVFVIDLPAEPDRVDTVEPVVLLHGFPTSSFDYHLVLDALSATGRRVILFDFLGFGLSDKPDVRYGIDLHADTTVAVLDALGVERFALVTHDMGDTVGGELLARTMPEGAVAADPAWGLPAGERPPTSGDGPPPRWAATITRRVITNGSIYLDLAELTRGQHLLWSAPDERLDDDTSDLVAAGLVDGLAQVCHPQTMPSGAEVEAMAEMACAGDGAALLPRLIRYLDDRTRAEARYTGAIETHSSPLTIVWAQQDPVARAPMGEQLARRRPDATLVRLDGVGHYPMIEAPDRFADALVTALT